MSQQSRFVPSGGSMLEASPAKVLLEPRMLDQIRAARHLSSSSSGLGSSTTQVSRCADSTLVKSRLYHRRKSVSAPSLTPLPTPDTEDSQDTAAQKEHEGVVDCNHQLLCVDNAMDLFEINSLSSFRSRSGVSNTSTSKPQTVNHEVLDSAKGLERLDRSYSKQRAEKSFLDFFTMVSSIHYGIGILMLSLTAYAFDMIMVNSYKAEITDLWNLVLSTVGILLLTWLIVDIERYIRNINAITLDMNVRTLFRLVSVSGAFHIEVPLTNKNKKRIPEYYGFTTGRHAGSFFLKIGAGLFCFGHLIHMGLNFVKRIVLDS